MRRFIIFLFVLTALCHIPFAIALSRVLTWAGAPGAPFIAVLVAALLVAFLRGRARRVRVDQPMPAWRLLLIEEPYFVHWGATVLSFVLFPLLLLVSFLASAIQGAGGGGNVDAAECAVASYGVGLLVSAWSVLVRRRWVRVRTVDIAIPGLAESFDGYRIAQLSDLHIGSMCPRSRGDGWVDRVNNLDVDLVALTGDYTTSGTVFHRDIAGMLSNLRARDGVLAVMGNHDYFGEGEHLVTLLREGGIRVLRNEWTTVDRAGKKLTVAGVDDTWTRRANVGRALAGHDKSAPVIALSHDPSLFPKLAQGGAALVLSGHTHWGQVAAPFLATRYNLSRFSYRYHAGMYEEHGSTLYINPGLGTTGPPIRLGAAPEITILRLRRAGEAREAREA